MEQKDYLLKEIEKISMVLRAILNNLFGKEENMAITQNNQFNKTKELLFNEINFDLAKYLAWDEKDSKEYLSQFKGINTENLELLAEILFKLGINEQIKNKDIYFRKAIQLYMLCNEKDKTFSIDRDKKIKVIKNYKNYMND